MNWQKAIHEDIIAIIYEEVLGILEYFQTYRKVQEYCKHTYICLTHFHLFSIFLPFLTINNMLFVIFNGSHPPSLPLCLYTPTHKNFFLNHLREICMQLRLLWSLQHIFHRNKYDFLHKHSMIISSLLWKFIINIILPSTSHISVLSFDLIIAFIALFLFLSLSTGCIFKSHIAINYHFSLSPFI